MKAWIVLNDEENPVTLDSAPWDDGECLYDRTPEAFTVFLKEESAEEALETTKKYCKSQKLDRYWHMRKWNIISIDIPYSVDQLSSGKVHLRASLLLAAGFSVGAIISQDSKIFECAVGAMIGTMVTPDLDLSNGGVVGGKFIRKKVGWIGEGLWKFFWRGYSESFKHGTWASHSPIFSTLVRVFYVYYWVILIPHVLIYFLFSPQWSLIYVLSWYAKIFLSPMFLYGLMSSDLIHWTLDKLTKESK